MRMHHDTLQLLAQGVASLNRDADVSSLEIICKKSGEYPETPLDDIRFTPSLSNRRFLMAWDRSLMAWDENTWKVEGDKSRATLVPESDSNEQTNVTCDDLQTVVILTVTVTA